MGGFFDDVLNTSTDTTSTVVSSANTQPGEVKTSSGFFADLIPSSESTSQNPQETPQQILNKPEDTTPKSMLQQMWDVFQPAVEQLPLVGGITKVAEHVVNQGSFLPGLAPDSAVVSKLAGSLAQGNYKDALLQTPDLLAPAIAPGSSTGLFGAMAGQVSEMGKFLGTLGTEVGPMKYMAGDDPNSVTGKDGSFGFNDYVGLLNPYKDLRLMGNTLSQLHNDWKQATGHGVQGDLVTEKAIQNGPKEALSFLWSHPQAQKDIIENFVATGVLAAATGGGSLETQGAMKIGEGASFAQKILPSMYNAALNPMTHVITAETLSSSFNQRYEKTGDLYGSLSKSFVDGMGTFAGLVGLGPVAAIEKIPGVAEPLQGFVTTMTKWLLSTSELTGFGIAAKQVLGEDNVATHANEFWLNALFSVPALEGIGAGFKNVKGAYEKFGTVTRPEDVRFFESETNVKIISDLALLQQDQAHAEAVAIQARKGAEDLSILRVPGINIDFGKELANELKATDNPHEYLGPISAQLANFFNVPDATFARFSSEYGNQTDMVMHRLITEGVTVGQNGGALKSTKSVPLEKLKKGDVLMSWDVGQVEKVRVRELESLIDQHERGNNVVDPKTLSAYEQEIAIKKEMIKTKEKKAKEVFDITKKMQDIFNLEHPIILSDRADPGNAGHIWAVSFTDQNGRTQKVHLVNLTKSDYALSSGKTSTLIHELGHAFGMEKMKGIVSQFGPEITKAYLDDITQGTGKFGSRSLQEFFNRTDSHDKRASDAGKVTYPNTFSPESNGYKLSIVEWFANKFARAVLKNEPGTFGDKLVPLVTEWQRKIAIPKRTNVFLADSLKDKQTGPLTKNDEVFMNVLQSFALEHAVKMQKKAFDMTPERVALLQKQLEDGTITRQEAELEGYRAEEYPATPSVLWNTYFTEGYSVPFREFEKAIQNTNIPESERRALADVIHVNKLDKNPEGSYEVRDIAAGYDQALRFRYNEQAMFNKLKPWEQSLKRLFGTDPKAPRIYGDMVETGKIATIFNTMLQIAEKNPNHRYINLYKSLNEDMASLRLPIQNEMTQQALSMKQLLKPSQAVVQDFFRKVNRGEVPDLIRVLLGNDGVPQDKIDKMSDRQVMSNWQNYEASIKKTYKISNPEWEAITKLNESMKGITGKIKEAELKSIQKNPLLDEAGKQLATTNLNNRFRKLNTDFYMPEMRFGEHVLVIRARDTYTDPSGRTYEPGQTIYREHFETESQRDKAWQNAKQSPELKDQLIGVDRLSKNERFLRGLPLDFLYAAQEDIKNVLIQRGLQGSELDNVMKGVQDLIRSHSTDTSYTRRLMQRNNIDGASNDLPRILAAYGESAGNHYARTNVRMDMDKNFTDFQNYVDELQKDTGSYANPKEVKKTVDRQRILLDYMKRHRDYIFNPGWEFDGLKNLGFVWALGFNAKSAVVNLTSIPLFTHSFLASKFGDGASASELSKAMKDVMEWRVRGKSANINDRELNMMEVAREGGLSNQTIARDAASLALSSPITRIVGGALNKVPGITQGEPLAAKISEGLHSFSQMSGMMFQYTENYAREVAILAAIRLADKAGLKDPKGQFDFARQTVNTSLFEYGRWNRPAIMRGVGSPIFLFQQFGLNALYFATRRNSAALRFGMAMFLAGGMMGEPVAEDAANLSDAAVNLAKRMTGSNGIFDTRLYLRDLFESVGMNSDMMMNGAARNGLGVGSLFAAAAGDGSGEASFDISKSLSQGRLIPFSTTSILRDLAMGKQVDLENKVTEGVGGAAGSVVFKMLGLLGKTFSDQSVGLKDVEKALPTAIGSAMKAARYATTGVETDNTGNQTRSFDVNNPQDLADIYGYALNFVPQKDAIAKEKINKAYEQNMYWMSQKSGLLAKVRSAYQAGLLNGKPNALEIQRAMQEVEKFNKDAPGIYAISSQALKASIRNQQKDAIYQSMGYINGPKSQNTNQYDQQYPEGNDKPDLEIR